MIRALADAALVRGREEVERPQVAVAVRVVVPHVQRVQVRTVREHAAHFGSPPFASSTNYSRGVVAAIVWPVPVSIKLCLAGVRACQAVAPDATCTRLALEIAGRVKDDLRSAAASLVV